MERWSPYASNYDNPITFTDPLGDEPDDGPGDPPGLLSRIGSAIVEGVKQVAVLGAGVANAWGSNQVLGVGRKSAGDVGFTNDRAAFYKAGQTVGDAASVVTGAIEGVFGGGTEIATVGGSTAVSVPIALHGGKFCMDGP